MSSPSYASVSLRQFSTNPWFHSIVSGQCGSHFVLFFFPVPSRVGCNSLLKMDWTAARPRQLSVFRQRRVSKVPRFHRLMWFGNTWGGPSKGGRKEIPRGRRKGTSSGVLTTFNQAQSACINILMESKAICFHPSPEKCVQQCFSDKATVGEKKKNTCWLN